MIGINTYGLSSALKRDIVGTMSALRDAGVGAIEPCAVFTDALGGMRSAFCRMGFGLAGLTGGTWFGKLADKRTELALKYFDKVAGVHCALAESGRHTAERVVRPALEYAERHGSPFIVFSPMAYTADAVQRFVPALTLAVREGKARGIGVLVHNHAGELRGEPGSRPLDKLFSEVPGLGLELDVGWAMYAGCDPAEEIARYSDVLRIVHLKDIRMGKKGKEMFAAIGEGDLPLSDVLSAAFACEFAEVGLIIDQDASSDIIRDVRVSVENISRSTGHLRD